MSFASAGSVLNYRLAISSATELETIEYPTKSVACYITLYETHWLPNMQHNK